MHGEMGKRLPCSRLSPQSHAKEKDVHSGPEVGEGGEAGRSCLQRPKEGEKPNKTAQSRKMR